MTVDPRLPPRRIEAMHRRGWWRDETLLDSFDAALAAHPDDLALVDYRVETRERHALTYRELDARARRIALGLVHHGVGPRDVVSFQLPNWWEFAAVHLACLRIGAISNPLMPIFRERELSYMVAFAESRVMIVPHRFRGFDHAAMMAGLAPRLPRLAHWFTVGGDGERDLARVLLDHPWEQELDAEAIFAARRPAALEVIEVMYTSGTTGTPKGVMHPSATLLFSIREFIARTRMSATDVMFMGSPLAHQTGFLYGLWLPFVLGTRAVLLDQWQVDAAWRLIAAEDVSCTMSATPFLADLTDAPAAAQCNSPRFRLFVCGGAPVPRALAQRAARELGIDIMTVWGMTECGVITSTRLDDPPAKTFETDGVALPGCDVRILDAAGGAVPCGEEGRVFQRSPSTFVGYLKRPDAYGFHPGGYFDTGDLARMDADGYIRITGRSKDLIIRGGENVPVVEIESVLYNHPAIVDVAIVAMPDARLGELGCCFVTLAPGQALSFGTLQAWLTTHKVAKNYWPEHLEVVAEMPRTASGKIQKFQLREIAKNLRAQAQQTGR